MCVSFRIISVNAKWQTVCPVLSPMQVLVAAAPRPAQTHAPMGEWCAGADRPRGGGPRLTALMPCKRELDATNPGAAFLREAGFEVRPLHNYSSIFAAYSAGVGSLQPEQDDIVMLVHDDVAFDGSPAALRQSLQRHLAYPGVGFVGAAGTRRLQPELVWWRGQSDMTTLAGMCHHGLRPSDPASFRSFFGPFGRVVVLDGVLLAATGRTLRSVRLDAPAGLGDVWHFYDVSYTLQAHVASLVNLALPLGLRHASRGQTGAAWEAARAVLARRLRVLLPLSVPRSPPLPPPPGLLPAAASAAEVATRYAVLLPGAERRAEVLTLTLTLTLTLALSLSLSLTLPLPLPLPLTLSLSLSLTLT